MRVLFVVDAPGALRHAAPVLPALADGGHVVMVAFNAASIERQSVATGSVVDPRIDWVGSFPARDDGWESAVRGLRGWMDVARFFDERFAASPVLRDRMIAKILPARPYTPTWSAARTATVLTALQDLASVIPVSARAGEFLRVLRPDVVVVTNLIDPQTDQADIVQAAQQQGRPTVYVVTSWDNLTNRGHIHVKPDVIVVWNEAMRQEAMTFHGMSASAIRIAGAPVFDTWFDRTPSGDCAAFCRRVGLPDGHFLLYAGSSPHIAQHEREVAFVRRWQAALGDEWPILLRPHPMSRGAWLTETLPNVAVWPRVPADATPETLYDALTHCAAVVGINTTVMIEAAILGKPVLTVLAPEFVGTQGGTLHFRHLRDGGYVRVADTFDAHRRQLTAALADPAAIYDESRAFVSSFFRPHGIDVPHTPIVAAAITSAGRC